MSRGARMRRSDPSAAGARSTGWYTVNDHDRTCLSFNQIPQTTDVSVVQDRKKYRDSFFCLIKMIRETPYFS